MNTRTCIALLISLALSVASLYAGPRASAAQRLEVLPMTSIVRPVKLDDEDYQWETVVQSHLNGNIIHNSVFRPPTGPTEAVPVDCSQTRSIGVYFQVETESKHKDKMRPFRFSWSHNGIDPEEPVRSDFKSAWFAPSVRGVMIYSDRLKLTDTRRVNGEWQLQVYHMGEEIFREEFNLVFCERPYAPTWYRDNNVPISTAPIGAAGITVSGFNAEPGVDDDPLIAQIEDTIEAIDTALNDYILGYLKNVGLQASEFGPIERKLLRAIRQERKDDPATYQQVPENIHLLQAKVQFLQSAHPEFQGGRFPQAITDKFAKLGRLEERLRQEEAGEASPSST